ncbi:hypothetical protein [Oceanobacillus salinisoli]|uniref:hypothetical protein n=1 Tax=Oceanobacillus salinisoli TaxID=2678611 RepID=UPI0012E23E6D|nr:hypothetical protein [Oceanobacillus salinisoli]
MSRTNFYKKLSTELLGCFYFYIHKNIDKGINVNTLLHEKAFIEKEAEKRGISLIELRIIGYWITQKEKNLTKNEKDQN